LKICNVLDGFSESVNAAFEADGLAGALQMVVGQIDEAIAGFAALAPVVAGVAAIIAGMAIYNHIIESADRAIASAEQHAQAAAEARSEYEKIDKESKEIQGQIDALTSKTGELTQSEQDQLTTLEAQNKVLETRLQIYDKIAQYEAEQAARDASNALSDSNYGKNGFELSFGSTDKVVDMILSGVNGAATPIEQLQRLYNTIEKLQAQRKETEEKLAGSKVGSTKWNPYPQQIEAIDEALSALNEEYKETDTDVQSLLSKMTDPDTGEALPGFEDDVKKITDAYLALGETINQVAVDEPISEQIGIEDADTAIETVAKLTEEFKTLSEAAEGFETFTTNMDTLSEALVSLDEGTLTLEDVWNLVAKFPKLAKYVDSTADNFGDLKNGIKQLKADNLKDTVSQLKAFADTLDPIDATRDAIYSLCDEMENMAASETTGWVDTLSDKFVSLSDEINASKQAIDDISAAMGENSDAGFDSRVKAYEALAKAFDEGTVGSMSNVWQIAEALGASLDVIADKDPQTLFNWVENTGKFFQEGTDGVHAFLDAIKGSEDALELFNTFSWENGVLDFDIDNTNLQALGEVFGLNADAVYDLITALGQYYQIQGQTPDDLITYMDEVANGTQTANDKMAALKLAFEQGMKELGATDEQIQIALETGELETGIEEIDNFVEHYNNAVTVANTPIKAKSESGGMAPTGQELTVTPKIDTSNTVSQWEAYTASMADKFNITITPKVESADADAALDTTQEKIDNLDATEASATVTDDTGAAKSGLQYVDTLMVATDRMKPSATVLDNTAPARSGLSTVWSYLQNVIRNKTQTITVNYKTTGTPYASGTKSATGGTALLGDEYSPSGTPKPELVVSKSSAYLAGINGPVITRLNSGDVVYTADETKKILQNSGFSNRIPAFASGSGTLWSGKTPSWYTSSSTKSSSSSSGRTTTYSGTGSSSSSSSSSTSTSEDLETIDWIERAIKKIEDAIESLEQTAGSAYVTLRENLEASYSQIAAVTDEIAIQTAARDRYLQQANSVGLDSGLAEKVRNGTIDISQYSEDTAELISQYQEWYDKSQDCTKSINELHESLGDLYSGIFDSLQQDSENQISLLEHSINMTTRLLNEYSSASLGEIKDYYAQLESLQNDSISILQDEYTKLVDALQQAVASGKVAEGSQEWYDMVNSINDVEEAIADANEQINKLSDEMFDRIQDDFDNEIDMLEYVSNAYSSQLSDTVVKTKDMVDDLYTSMREVAEQQLTKAEDKVAEMSKALKDDLASGIVKEGTQQWYDRQKAIASAKEEVTEYIEAIRSMASSKGEDILDTYALRDVQRDRREYKIQNYIDTAQTPEKKAIYYARERSLLEGYTDILRQKAADYYAVIEEARKNENFIGSKEEADMLSTYYGMLEDIDTRVQKLQDTYSDAMDDIDEYYSRQQDLAQEAADTAAFIANEYNGQGLESIYMLYETQRVVGQKQLALQKEITAKLIAERDKAVSDGVWNIGDANYDNATLNINKSIEEERQYANAVVATYSDMFNAISKYYDQQADLVKHDLNVKTRALSEYMDVSISSAKDTYAEMKRLTEKNISITTDKLNELIRTRDEAVATGKIKEGSVEWNNLTSQINKTEEEVYSLHQSINSMFGDLLSFIKEFYSVRNDLIQTAREMYEAMDDEYHYHSYGSSRDYAAHQIQLDKQEIQNILDEISEAEKHIAEMLRFGEAGGGYNENSIAHLTDLNYLNELKNNLTTLVRTSGGSAMDKVFNDFADSIDKAATAYTEAAEDIQNGLNDYAYISDDMRNQAYSNLRSINSANLTDLGYGIQELESILQEAVDSEYIEKYSDKWYAWIGVIDNLKERQNELQQTTKGLYVEQFNSVEAAYDNQLALASEGETVDLLTQKIAAMIHVLSMAVAAGDVTEGSQAWYTMQLAINKAKQSLNDFNTSQANAAATARQNARDAAWDKFDYIEERLADLTAEAKFLIDLLSDDSLYTDNGQLSNAGLATAALHEHIYEVLMQQAQDYADELEEINAQLARSPSDADLIDRREDLLSLQRESILNAEKEKQAIIDLVEDGIEIELDNLKQLIDTYNDALDSSKDLHDYEKSVSEKSSNIASLQKQISAYSGDNSEETRARLQKLQVELNKAQEDLQETEYDRYISDQKKLLDDLYNEYEEALNSRLDDVDSLLADISDKVSSNAGAIRDTILQASDEVGYTISGSMGYLLQGEAMSNVLAAIKEVAAAVNLNTEQATSAAVTGANTLEEITMEQLRVDALTQLVNQLLEDGTLNPEQAEALLKAIGAGTEEEAKSAAEIIKSLYDGGVLSGEQAKTLYEATYMGLNDLRDAAVSELQLNADKTATTIEAQSGALKTILDTLVAQGYIDQSQANAILSAVNSGADRIVSAIGDIDRNGTIDQADVEYLARSLAGWEGYDTVDTDVGDLNGDGVVNRLDRVLLNRQVAGYDTGGLNTQPGVAILHGTANKPELVLDAQDTKTFMDFVDILRGKGALTSNISRSGIMSALFGGGIQGVNPRDLTNIKRPEVNAVSQNVGSINLTIAIDKVMDYNDLVTQMQNDKQIERFIQSCSTDLLKGKAPILKNTIKFNR